MKAQLNSIKVNNIVESNGLVPPKIIISNCPNELKNGESGHLTNEGKHLSRLFNGEIPNQPRVEKAITREEIMISPFTCFATSKVEPYNQYWKFSENFFLNMTPLNENLYYKFLKTTPQNRERTPYSFIKGNISSKNGDWLFLNYNKNQPSEIDSFGDYLKNDICSKDQE